MTNMTNTESIQDDIRQMLNREVRAGFAPVDRMTEYVYEILEEEQIEAMGDGLDGFIKQTLAELIAAHQVEQETWPAITDFDRLEQAFSILEAQRIVARHNFACCQSCGHGEIRGEISDLDYPVLGYTFYHMQDTDGAVDGGDLCLAYGVADPAVPLTQIGWRIVEAMNAAGLKTEWNGDPNTRVFVKMDWKRRR